MIEKERRLKEEVDQQINGLEQRESEFIENLKNTNNLEMEAMDDLKNVLNGEFPDHLNKELNVPRFNINKSIQEEILEK